MALLRMVFRKMVKNRIFVFFLTIGLLISSALLSAIPMYTDGSLQRMLIKGMQEYQQSESKYPGTMLISYTIASDALDQAKKDIGTTSKSLLSYDSVKKVYADRLSTFNKVDDYSCNQVMPKMNVKAFSSFANYSTDPRSLHHEGFKEGDTAESSYSRIESYSNLYKHIKLTDGRLPKSGKDSDGVYEALVTDRALQTLKISLNRVYVLSDPGGNGLPDVKIKPVGTFTVKSSEDTYWAFISPDMLDNSMLIDQNTMVSDFIKKSPMQVTRAYYYYALDYQSLTIDKLSGFLGGYHRINSDLQNITKEMNVQFPASSIAQTYQNKKDQVTSMLWSLNVPVILLLCLYMFMVSGLIIERERNEISLLSSRGASKYQVLFGYLVEGLVLGIIAILIGPLLGFGLCKILGAASGFMEFVDRKSLQISIEIFSYLYVMLAILVFLVTLLVPAFRATRTSIVDHKREMARGEHMTLWEKFFVDVVLLVIAGYGYYTFTQRQQTLLKSSLSATDISIDPLLFFIPVIFILGIGLLFLRVYPYFVKLVYWLGKKHWPTPLYMALTQVGRSTRSYGFIMIFLIMTLSVGIFSANAARTINQNSQEKIYYNNGADMVINPTWVAQNTGSTSASSTTSTSDSGSTTSSSSSDRTYYYEPDYDKYQKLDGVAYTTKVYSNDNVTAAYQSKSVSGISLRAVEPYNFGMVTWWRSGLMSHHINEYLNLLSSEQTACLISRSAADAYGIKVGDSISVGWDTGTNIVLNVYGIIDYWPSWNPNKLTNTDSDNNNNSATSKPMLIVANFDYVQNNMGLEPYTVWCKLKPGATTAQVYKSITKNNLDVQSVENSKQELITLKNDPNELAINGSMTMGFLISGIICFMGFVLYWVLSMRARVLQFGVLRAMGLSSGQLKVMIAWEQLLTSGVAMIMGVLIGLISSSLFIPFFQMSYSGSDQVPPFHVVSYASDMVKVYIFIGFTVVLGVGVLIYMLNKIKISNVIKLGED